MLSSPPPPPQQSAWALKFSFFLRAIGLKRGFRRTGPSTLLNLFVAAGVGVVSGHYIFKDPLREYWEEKRAEEQQLQQQPPEGGSGSSTGAMPANNNNQ